MRGRKHRQKVVLPCADGPLRLVGAVVVRRGTLVCLEALKKETRSAEISLSMRMWVREWDREKKSFVAAISGEVRRRGARLERDKVDIVTMHE
jgi:hypothetical protein